MSQMNQKELKRANEISNECQEMMMYLKNRYNAEKKHEDFKAYSDHMKEFVAKFPEVKFIKASKRPFGFRFAFESYELVISCSNVSYSWKRVA